MDQGLDRDTDKGALDMWPKSRNQSATKVTIEEYNIQMATVLKTVRF